ncbi:DgyrCDS4310 [Dimorphilus gyrociliatus]|uniref:DgyrCDS4310 n=1 Tax=Dimorphilus gyrociliatus TaxID=2664684 RepID=A0A7I8VI18_9ANNE|nr:DgyrCDS4310 [Dimorphilus gyrociliatus]
MASTLVETVSLDYADFQENFLICPTCVFDYDGDVRAPKLLRCSHTVCKECLQRIADDARSSGLDSFRCPICRQNIQIPADGISSLQPSFVINQLVDLMSRQRREVVPKCCKHPRIELLFCETCDTVFCSDCEVYSTHSGPHTVIPFSTAIKRMSDILLFKANQCTQVLDYAKRTVQNEIDAINSNQEICENKIEELRTNLVEYVDGRIHEMLKLLTKTANEKKNSLNEQMNIVEKERSKIERECSDAVSRQLDVRNITQKISDITQRLEVANNIAEPRENSFMQFLWSNNELGNVKKLLNNIGKLRLSSTLPALSRVSVQREVTVHLSYIAKLTTIDKQGIICSCGGDPVQTTLTTPNGIVEELDVVDNNDGTYDIRFSASQIGKHVFSVTIFGRRVKNSPFDIYVTEHQSASKRLSYIGTDVQLKRPLAAIIDNNSNKIYISDTGNGRIVILEADHLTLKSVIHCSATSDHSATGLSLTDRNSILVANWRQGAIFELDETGQALNTIRHKEIKEPTCVAFASNECIAVLDSLQKKILILNINGDFVCFFSGSYPNVKALYGHNGNIIVAGSDLRTYSPSGECIRNTACQKDARGLFSGVCVDKDGYILATHSHKQKSVVKVFEPESSSPKFDIDSFDDKLYRPSGVVALPGARLLVVDLGNDCLKVFRYK